MKSHRFPPLAYSFIGVFAVIALSTTSYSADRADVVVLISAARDLRPEDIAGLAGTYGAVAADWESGAIAYTAKRNRVPCLILRAVSDIVGRGGSDAYGNLSLFRERAAGLMKSLINGLPRWLDAANAVFSK